MQQDLRRWTFTRAKVVHGTRAKCCENSGLPFRNDPNLCRVQRQIKRVPRAQLPAPTRFPISVDRDQSFVDDGLGFAAGGRDACGLQKLKQVDVLGVDAEGLARLANRNEGWLVGSTSRMTL